MCKCILCFYFRLDTRFLGSLSNRRTKKNCNMELSYVADLFACVFNCVVNELVEWSNGYLVN